MSGFVRDFATLWCVKAAILAVLAAPVAGMVWGASMWGDAVGVAVALLVFFHTVILAVVIMSRKRCL